MPYLQEQVAHAISLIPEDQLLAALDWTEEYLSQLKERIAKLNP